MLGLSAAANKAGLARRAVPIKPIGALRYSVERAAIIPLISSTHRLGQGRPINHAQLSVRPPPESISPTPRRSTNTARSPTESMSGMAGTKSNDLPRKTTVALGSWLIGESSTAGSRIPGSISKMSCFRVSLERLVTFCTLSTGFAIGVGSPSNSCRRLLRTC